MSSAPPQAKPVDATPSGLPPLDGLPPAMRQYVEQKRRVGDAVLLFRMGDFYETFFDDAVLCSNVLGIALTSRGKHSDNPIPLAGIPYHALDAYLKKLVDAGYKVAVSEQLEDPKKAKGVVKRDVVRIVTAGTLTDETLLSERDDNLLAAICLTSDATGLALIELASGRFEVLDVSRDTLLDELVRARPAELIINDDRGGAAERLADELRQLCGTSTTRRPAHEFSSYQGERSLLDHFDVSTLAGFGFDAMSASLSAAGCIVGYLRETQKTSLAHITAIRRRSATDYLQMDHATWRSLEIERTLRSGQAEGSLLWAVDRTLHPHGGRKLRHWLRRPLTNKAGIVERQDAIAFLMDGELVRVDVRRRLKSLADVERIAGRVALGRTSPRELSALGKTLAYLPNLAAPLRESRVAFLSAIADDFEGHADGAKDRTKPNQQSNAPNPNPKRKRRADATEPDAPASSLAELTALLTTALRDDQPPNPREGGYIADGFDTELDRLRAIGRDGQQWLADYQRREAERTGLTNLKVGFNRVFGYYLEIPNSARDQAPADYVRKQTIKNAERYITDELKHYETEALTAQERAVSREASILDNLRQRVAAEIETLMRLADALGRLDCVAALAELAVQRAYVRPEFAADDRLDIHDGRHPVLDRALGDDFVPNDTAMSPVDARVFVITGPNMAGKSTYIRQVALLTLLTQTGSFVPAAGMTCSIVDRLFARVGSSDEIMRGQSTFMVEMTEAANILHNATPRSLVVLDELGRGTSTFDGLSLAWAITEHLTTEIKCKALVATHYHELTELAELLQGVRNFNVAVRETQATKRVAPASSRCTHRQDAGATLDEGIVFLHKIVPGGASKSYGVHVARLAGIPKPVIERSREVLAELERGFERESHAPTLSKKKTRDTDQFTLFDAPPAEVDPNLIALRDELAALDPNELTPLEALQRLAEWKKKLEPQGEP